MLDELKRREIHMVGKPMGIVSLEDASDLLQILEIKMLNEYGPVLRKRKRIYKPVSQDKALIVRVAEKEPSGHARADVGNGS